MLTVEIYSPLQLALYSDDQVAWQPEQEIGIGNVDFAAPDVSLNTHNSPHTTQWFPPVLRIEIEHPDKRGKAMNMRDNDGVKYNTEVRLLTYHSHIVSL